jgi:phosphoribosylformimino-5-aminoimidazole carboxamide ribotide isomerase
MCSLSKGITTPRSFIMKIRLRLLKSLRHGIEYLHLVDLDGAKSSQIVNYKILEQIASQTN